MAITTEGPQTATETGSPVAATQRRVPPMTLKLGVGLSIAGLIVLFGLIGPLLVGDPSTVRDIGLTGPGNGFVLGTTQSGQDVFAQLAYATRGSLIIGVVVGAITLLLSSFFGVVGAFVGGWADEAFSLLTNIMLVIPGAAGDRDLQLRTQQVDLAGGRGA